MSSALARGVAGVNSVDDLDAYELAVRLRRRVLALVRDGRVSRDFKYADQIRNAARGAPRNIAEGYSRFIPTEFKHFLSYAKASLDEVKNHITDGQECEYFSDEEAQELLTLVRRTLGAVRELMRYLDSPEAMRRYKAIVKARKEKPWQPRSKPREPLEPENPNPKNPKNPKNQKNQKNQ